MEPFGGTMTGTPRPRTISTKLASSAESVGVIRLWKFPKGVVQANLGCFGGSVTARFFHGQFCVGVETLDGAGRDHALRVESVEDQLRGSATITPQLVS